MKFKEKGTNPIYNLSGKKGLQPSNNPAAAYMTGSPVKHSKFSNSHSPDKLPANHKHEAKAKTGFFGQIPGTGMFGEGSILEPAFKRKIRSENAANIATTNNNFVPNDFGEGSETQNSLKPNIGVKSNDGGATPAVKTPKKRTKINPSAKIEITPKGITVDSGIGAIKTSKITSKKSTPPSAKITKAQIKANKADNKESGMSKRQIRLEKTKLKAANARYETTSDKTKAIGGKEGQRKAAKTKRLEKRASRIEGRIKRKADKKANK